MLHSTLRVACGCRPSVVLPARRNVIASAKRRDAKKPKEPKTEGADGAAAAATPASETESAPPPGPPIESGPIDPSLVREYKAYGMRVIETNEAIRGPEEEPDFWEREEFTNFGSAVQQWFLPALAVAAVLVGIYASNTYDEGATVFQTTASNPDDLPDLIPAAKVLNPPPAAPEP